MTVILTFVENFALDNRLFGYILIFMKTAAIILNTPDEIGQITESDVICADNGLSRIHVTPVAVVGDLDSLENRKDGLNYVVFPKEKDETDGQLALDYAKSAGYDAVTIYGATGGDIGQILGNIGLLKYAKDIKSTPVFRASDSILNFSKERFSTRLLKARKFRCFRFSGTRWSQTAAGFIIRLKTFFFPQAQTAGFQTLRRQTKSRSPSKAESYL